MELAPHGTECHTGIKMAVAREVSCQDKEYVARDKGAGWVVGR